MSDFYIGGAGEYRVVPDEWARPTPLPVVKPVLVLVEGGLPTPICYPESMELPRPYYAVMRGGGEDDFGLQSLLLSCDALLCDKGNPLADVAKKVGMKVFHSIEEMNV